VSRKIVGVRDQRALGLGAAAVLGLIAVFRGLPAWRAWRAEARAAAVESITHEARTGVLLAGLAESLDTLEARTAGVRVVGPALLTGETAAAAASNLAALLADVARQSLVRLDAVDVRADTSKAHALPRVAVEVQATADIVGLSSLVHALERGPVLLAVRRLSVRPQSVDSPTDQVETLSIRLTVEGLALVQTPRDAL